MVWVEFQYENLPTFYFYCGRRGCEHKIEDSRNNCICEGQYASWLRAQPIKGEKKEDLSEKGTSGNLRYKQVKIVREEKNSPGRGDEGRGIVMSII